MNLKKIIISILVIYVIFSIGLGIFAFFHHVKASGGMFRLKRNFNRSWISNHMLEMYAGCQIRVMMDERTDEAFSEMWERDSKEYDFDAIDVDRYMMKSCPPGTENEIGVGIRKYQKSYERETGNRIEESEIIGRIEKEIRVSGYQLKFLNREFTALKDEPKE